MNRNIFGFAFIFFSIQCLGQNKNNSIQAGSPDIATPGIGLTKILIGKTTFDEVKNTFGKIKTDKPGSGKDGGLGIPFYSLDYPNLGLSFITPDKRQIVSSIYVTEPYKISTNLGITWGATKKEVIEKYGQPKADNGSTIDYNGICFYFSKSTTPGIGCFGPWPEKGTEQDLNTTLFGMSISPMDSGIAFGNSERLAKKYKMLHLYTWGLPAYGVERDSCVIELSKYYGVDEITSAGCMIKSGQHKRWNRHNDKVDKKMQKRFGPDWQETYDAELSKCMKQSH